jgi:hypothetical protein
MKRIVHFLARIFGVETVNHYHRAEALRGAPEDLLVSPNGQPDANGLHQLSTVQTIAEVALLLRKQDNKATDTEIARKVALFWFGRD